MSGYIVKYHKTSTIRKIDLPPAGFRKFLNQKGPSVLSLRAVSKAYLGHCQASKMEYFCKNIS